MKNRWLTIISPLLEGRATLLPKLVDGSLF